MKNATRHLLSLDSMTRRSALSLFAAGGAAVALGQARPLHAQTRSLRVGTTFDNSGVEKANGTGLYMGSSAFFNALNKSGGIGGSKVELLMADDTFKPEVAKENALNFAKDKSVLALLHPLGTRQSAALMEAVQDMAIVGPSTGTVALRKKPSPNTFWLRANYDQEIDKLVGTAQTLGITRIGLVHSKDPLGQSVLAGFQASMAKHKLQPAVIGTTPATTSMEVEPAAEAIAKGAPQLVIMGLAGTAPAFVRALRQQGALCSIYGLSITASDSNIKQLGELSRGIGFSIIVPSPFAAKHEIVRRYQADMKASGFNDFSLPSLEGYITARVLSDGMRQAGKQISRESVIASLARTGSSDLGGITITFGNDRREGSDYVDVAVVASNGRLMS